MLRKLILAVAILMVCALILTSCKLWPGYRNDADYYKIMNTSDTNAEYQNTRMLLGLTNNGIMGLYGNLEMVKEALANGATSEHLEIPQLQKYDAKFPSTALGVLIGQDDPANRMEKLMVLLNSGVNPDSVDDTGKTGLSICAERFKQCWAEYLPVLLEHGADPNIVSKEGYTALEYYLKNDREKEDNKIVDLFLQHGAKVTAQTMRLAYQNYRKIDLLVLQKLAQAARAQGQDTGLSPLAEAALLADTDKLKQEIDKGIPEQDRELVTACAAAFGNPDLLEKLQISQPSDAVNQYECPLLLAAKYGNLANVQYLAGKGMDVNKGYKAYDTKFTPMLWAVKNDHLDIAKYLIDSGSEIKGDIQNFEIVTGYDGFTDELSAAAQSGDMELAKLLLNAGARTDEKHICSAMKGAIMGKQMDILRFLVERYKSCVNPSVEFYSPLVSATRDGNTEAMEYVISQGALVNGNESGFGSPLSNAFYTNIDTLKLLLDKGADPNFDYGKDNGQLLFEAIEKGDLEEIKLLVEHDAKLDDTYLGYDVVQYAAACGSVHILQYLIEAGCPLNKGYDGYYNDWNDVEIVEPGDTPLHIATRCGYREEVQALLVAGADATIKNSEGKIAYDVAVSRGNQAIMQLFTDAGKAQSGGATPGAVDKAVGFAKGLIDKFTGQ